MQTKTKNTVVTVLFCLFFFGGALLCLLKPADDYSFTERRKLDSFPVPTLSSILSTRWMSDFEDYTLDQFPFRDSFRQIKAITHYYVFAQKENNSIYIADGSVSKLEYPLNEGLVEKAGEKFQKYYNQFFAGTDAKLYYSVIPDKNYFLAEENGFPALDYERLLAIYRSEMDANFTYIDIFDALSAEHYYRTDTHWRQEMLSGVVDALAAGMGVKDSLVTEYEEKTVSPFYGVYYGQSALPMAPDSITYLTNDNLEGCIVTNHEKGSVGGIYDMEKASSPDAYELFLSGAVSLMTIENPAATSDRELVIFRDSFGSSITPLLVSAYAKITLVDTRYAMPDLIETHYPTVYEDIVSADDVLFLYSTMILNNSSMLK